MKNVRLLHLYLGCFFTPLLIFFALTGVLQAFDWHHYNDNGSKLLAMLSTLHTSNGWKVLGTLSTPFFKWLTVLMAISFVFSMLLGVYLALKYSRKRSFVYLCLFMGFLTPLAIVALKL